MMKLYHFPVSNTARPVRLFIAENRLPVEDVVLDFMKGEHVSPKYLKLNPNGLVPTLVDDDFVLTESSTILKYLADKFDLTKYYPKDLKARARVNEMMDWFNTGFYRDYAYNVVYPQIYPHHKRPTEEAQRQTIEWGKSLTKKWLKTLNDSWLGKGKKFLTGDEMTIADFFGAALLTSGHVIRTEFKDYPNILAWLGRMQALPNWKKIDEAVEGFREYVKGQEFHTV
ncbi:MAG TPA: glutathione S-transferase family protein [Bauldia sp.]|nr:glutathione S-transferase family protein [Bauldia sp.]